MRSILRSNGIDARLTRTGDTFIPLYDRVEIAHSMVPIFYVHSRGWLYKPFRCGRVGICPLPIAAPVAPWRKFSDRENRADEVAGKKATDKDHLLQQVLFDLVQTDTIKNSLTLGPAYPQTD